MMTDWTLEKLLKGPAGSGASSTIWKKQQAQSLHGLLYVSKQLYATFSSTSVSIYFLSNILNNSVYFSIFKQTPSDLQRLATGVIVTVVHMKLITDDRGVYTSVNRALALCIVMVSIECQVGGIVACPLSRAHVDLEGYHAGATVDYQIRVV